MDDKNREDNMDHKSFIQQEKTECREIFLKMDHLLTRLLEDSQRGYEKACEIADRTEKEW